MNNPNTCPSCGGPYGEHASDCTALGDLRAAMLNIAEVWSHNSGRVFESMGSENPRAIEIDAAIIHGQFVLDHRSSLTRSDLSTIRKLIAQHAMLRAALDDANQMLESVHYTYVNKPGEALLSASQMIAITSTIHQSRHTLAETTPAHDA